MSWSVTVRAAQPVRVSAKGGTTARAMPAMRVTVPKQGPQGQPGASGDGASDPGDLTLIFENHLI